MADFGRGRSYPIATKEEVAEPGTEAKNDLPDYITLEPDWPSLLRWHLHAMATDSFDGHEGRRAALRSIVDITRYMAHKDPEELAKIMEEYS